MSDYADNKQFTELIFEALRDRAVRFEEVLHLAASHYQCGVEARTEWTTSTEGYVLETKFTLAPDLPAYTLREGNVISHYRRPDQ